MKSWRYALWCGLALAAMGCAEDPDGEGTDGEAVDAGSFADACGVGPLACSPEPEPEDCPAEGLWAVGDGRETALLVRLDPEAGARVVSHRVPEDTCSASAGRPGTGRASATFDAGACTIAVTSEASWCFSGEQQCREVTGTLDLRTGTFAGTYDVQACGFPGPGPQTAAVSRLEACPFTSRLDENAGPGVGFDPIAQDGGPSTYAGAATVSEVAESETGRQRVTLTTPEPGLRLFVNLPAPLRLALDDTVWVSGSVAYSGLGLSLSAVVLRRGEGVADASDSVFYAAVSRGVSAEVELALAEAGLALVPVPVCPLSTYCAPEGSGLALAVPGPAGSPTEPMAVPGEGFWLPSDSELWVQVHGGLAGASIQCSDTPDQVTDFEALRWPAPTF